MVNMLSSRRRLIVGLIITIKKKHSVILTKIADQDFYLFIF